MSLRGPWQHMLFDSPITRCATGDGRLRPPPSRRHQQPSCLVRDMQAMHRQANQYKAHIGAMLPLSSRAWDANNILGHVAVHRCVTKFGRRGKSDRDFGGALLPASIHDMAA